MATGTPDYVREITETPAWRDADPVQRRGWVRELAVATMNEGMAPEERGRVLDDLYDKADDKGVLGWLANAGEEALKSVGAGSGALVGIGAEVTGMTPDSQQQGTGSTDRLGQGVEDLLDSTVQRVKSWAPGDYQEQRDKAFAAFKADLDSGAYPPEFAEIMATPDMGGGKHGDEWKPGFEYMKGWMEVLSGANMLADRGAANFTPGNVQAFKTRRQGMQNPRAWELVADYMATRDPASWGAIMELGRETEVSFENRKAVEREAGRHVDFKPEESLLDDLSLRAAGYQRSPIDMALTAFPLLRGASAMKAAGGAKWVTALRETTKIAAVEFVSGAASEALSRGGLATGGEVLESGGMEAAGGAMLAGGGAVAGGVQRLLPGKSPGPGAAPGAPSVEAGPQGEPVAPGPGAAETGSPASAPAPVVSGGAVTRLPGLLDPERAVTRPGALLEGLVVEDEGDFAGAPELDGPADLSQPEVAGEVVTPVAAPAPVSASAPAAALEQAFRTAAARGASPAVEESPAETLEASPELLRYAAEAAMRDAGADIQPGTVASPPVPDTAETVAEQVRLALEPGSGRKAVLITPGTPRPAKTPGLKGVKTPHGLLLFNPKKLRLPEAMRAAESPVFDARILGMSEAASGQAPAAAAPAPATAPPVAVTASTPAADNVQAELVSDPAQLPAAIAAAEAAAPGARVVVKPAGQVLTERGKRVTAAESGLAVERLGRNAPEMVVALRVVESEGDLEAGDFTPEQWRSIVEQRPEGFFHRRGGGVVVILENVRRRRGETGAQAVTRVILHEQLGHRGLRAALGDAGFRRDWEALARAVPDGELAGVARDYPELAGDRMALVEEWFARNAEAAAVAPRGSLLRRLYEAFKAWVARVWRGFAGDARTLEQRTQDAIRASRRALESRARGGGQPQGKTDRIRMSTPQGAAQQDSTPPGGLSEADGLYLAAIESNDLDAAAEIILNEAEKAGAIDAEYGPLFHGTRGKFKVEDIKTPAFFTDSPDELKQQQRLNKQHDYGNKIVPAFLFGRVKDVEIDREVWAMRDLENYYIEDAKKEGFDVLRLTNGYDYFWIALTKRAVRDGAIEVRDMNGSLLLPSQRFQHAAVNEPSPAPSGGADSLLMSRAPRSPVEVRDFRPGTAVGAFQVKEQTMRRLFKGDALPVGMAPVLQRAGYEVEAIRGRMASLTGDLRVAMKEVVRRGGMTAEQVERAVQLALTGGRIRILPTVALQEAARGVRNLLDSLSDEVAKITGGTLGEAILDNKGHWMRRSYLAFDEEAEWNFDAVSKAAAQGKLYHGRDAGRILREAGALLQRENPTATPAKIEALMRQLMDRDVLVDSLAGSGPKVSKDVTSLMRRRKIPKVIRELMGEVKDPLRNALRSVSFQAQFIARHDQQQQLARMGLRSGLFSTKQEDVYTEPVGDGSQRWSGFYATTTKGKKVPLYTTPELMKAMREAPAVTQAHDVPHVFLAAIQSVNGVAKMNKVALSPDAAGPQWIGNIVSLIQNGALLWSDGWRNLAEAVRVYRSGKEQNMAALDPVKKALVEMRRGVLADMQARGVTQSASMQDMEATLDTAMLKFVERNRVWDKTVGFGHGALIGQSLGKAGGGAGRVVGGAIGGAVGAVAGEAKVKGALNAVAQWVVGHPDRIGKMTDFLTNLDAELASGIGTREQAMDRAAAKTLDTMPAYEKIPKFLRDLSKYGVLNSFLAFKHELVRNTYHNLRYGVQELRSGNAALMQRGARRLMGTAAIQAALIWGIPALAGMIGSGLDDNKKRAYRKWLTAPWERYANLNFTHFDKEKASFFGAGYLIPQSFFLEMVDAAREDKPLDALGDKLKQDFAEGNVWLDPLVEVWMNAKKNAPDRKITDKEGWAGLMEKIGYYTGRVFEPGAADKIDRMSRAATGRDTSTRQFSMEEEMLRLGGFRSYTYTHESRVKSRLYQFREQRDAITAAARSEWAGNAPGVRESLVEETNTRLEALAAEYEAFRADMKTLGLGGLAAGLRSDVGFKPGYRVKAGMKNGKSALVER